MSIITCQKLNIHFPKSLIEKVGSFLRVHGIPLLILLTLGLFSFLVDGILTFNFSWEKFLSEPIRTSSADITLLATFAAKLMDRDLFQNDYFISEFFDFYPKPFLYFISASIALFGSLEKALIALSILINIVFWISLYALLYFVSKSRFWSVVISLAALFYSRPAFGTMWWGTFKPIGVIPRNLISAFTPILVLLFIKYLRDKRIIYIFAFLGLLTNVHSISSLHITMWLGLAYLLQGAGRERIRTILISAVIWVLLSSPYLFSYVSSFFQSRDIPKEILEFRLGGYFLPTLNDVLSRGSAFLAPIGFGILGYVSAMKLKRRKIVSVYNSLLLSLLILISLGVILQSLNILVEFQFLRLTVYSYILFYSLSAIFFVYITERRDVGKKILSVVFSFAVLPILIFPKFEALARFAVEVPKTVVSKMISERKGSDGSIGFDEMSGDAGTAELKFSEGTLTFSEEEKGESSRGAGDFKNVLLEGKEQNSEYIEADLNVEERVRSKAGWKETWHINFDGNWVEFQELVDFILNNTDESDVFMLPPDGASIFRLFTKRNIVVSWKDGSASGFSEEYARRWFETYRDVRGAYHSLDADIVVGTAKKYNADYILIFEDIKLPLELKFNNWNFWLYKVK